MFKIMNIHLKEIRSVNMNIFRKKILFKSIVKLELS